MEDGGNLRRGVAAPQRQDEGRGVAASAVPYASIHRSAWNRYSPKFAGTEFPEVHLHSGLPVGASTYPLRLRLFGQLQFGVHVRNPMEVQ